MNVEDGVRAWEILRRVPAYRKAYRAVHRAAGRRHAPTPGLPERAPFPVRLQTAADLDAARFGLLAWEDPFAAGGPASPFWAEVPMLAAAAGPRATPLTGLGTAPGTALGAAQGVAQGVAITGLRLTDGGLVLKLESARAAVQLRLEPGSVFGPSDGVLVQHDLLAEPGEFSARLEEVHALAVGAGPRRGGGRGTGTC